MTRDERKLESLHVKLTMAIRLAQELQMGDTFTDRLLALKRDVIAHELASQPRAEVQRRTA